MISDLCPTCGRKKTRTIPQNRRYFELLRLLSNQEGYSVETWHEYMKRKYLPMHEVELPDWSTHLVTGSTAKLTMQEWETYTMHVEVFAAERGVYLGNDA